MCDIVKAWLCRGSGIWPKCDITRRQRPMRALVSFTIQKLGCQHAQNTTFVLFAAASLFNFKSAWFHIYF